MGVCCTKYKVEPDTEREDGNASEHKSEHKSDSKTSSGDKVRTKKVMHSRKLSDAMDMMCTAIQVDDVE